MNGTRWAISPARQAPSREEPVELGDDHRAALAAGDCEGTGELRPPLERIGALAGGCLDELGEESKAGGLGEAGDGGLLRLDAEAGAALPLGRDPVVGDGGRHRRLLRSSYKRHTTVCRLYVEKTLMLLAK
jgi:hypothetical protein